MEQKYKWSRRARKRRKKKLMALIYRARLRNPLLLSMSFLPRLHFSNHNSRSFISFSRKQPGFRYFVRSISEAAANPMVSRKEDEKQSPQNWKIKMLYDGDCPLCMREVNMLRERNNSYGTIKFVDISSDDYSPEENQGLDYETVMGRIHAILSDGTVVTDVEAFRRLYEEVGLGWVYAVTKYEPISKLADAIYAVWANYRLQITGRPPLDDILLERKKNKGEVCKDNNACKS